MQFAEQYLRAFCMVGRGGGLCERRQSVMLELSQHLSCKEVWGREWFEGGLDTSERSEPATQNLKS